MIVNRHKLNQTNKIRFHSFVSGLVLFSFAGKTNRNNEKFQFWQQHNHPIELFSNDAIETNIDYIHQNPVRNGLVEAAEDYIYSSAKNYAEEKGILDVELL